MKKIFCNLCGSDHHVVVYRSAQQKKANDPGYKITDEQVSCPDKILRCVTCGLVFVPEGDDANKLIDSYKAMVDPEYLQEEAGRRKTARTVLKKLKLYQNQGKSLLDVGCSTGFFLDEAKNSGWDVQGVEVSTWAAAYAKEKLDLNVFNGTLKQADFPANSFDVVVMHDTIEHIADPKHLLVEIRRVLKPTGIIYINTPNIESLVSRILRAKWWGINRYHLFYFSKKTLKKLLDATGFKTVRWGLYARSFTLRYWMKRGKTYNKFLYSLIKMLARIGGLEKKFVTVNFCDQIEVFARKRRSLEYLSELEAEDISQDAEKMKTIVVLPAYNAAKTLKATYEDIPKDIVDEIILVDDKSRDDTVKIAKELGITVYEHKVNKGYGANQKTCYEKALEHGADIVVMVHPDYQYDPTVVPNMIEPIKRGRADAVFGSRMLKGGALIGGMPLWKHNVNILLTALANIILKTYLTEYHSGFRAYSAAFLKSIRFKDNSDNFVFDFEVITQAISNYCKIEEIPIKTRYFDEASSIKLGPSIIYGLGILYTLFKFMLHEKNMIKFKQFE
jgi:2-polyprenyl-3-methyl-5-hydroxy-6-metoxy-1,4-benzoquinol methylase